MLRNVLVLMFVFLTLNASWLEHESITKPKIDSGFAFTGEIGAVGDSDNSRALGFFNYYGNQGPADSDWRNEGNLTLSAASVGKGLNSIRADGSYVATMVPYYDRQGTIVSNVTVFKANQNAWSAIASMDEPSAQPIASMDMFQLTYTRSSMEMGSITITRVVVAAGIPNSNKVRINILDEDGGLLHEEYIIPQDRADFGTSVGVWCEDDGQVPTCYYAIGDPGWSFNIHECGLIDIYQHTLNDNNISVVDNKTDGVGCLQKTTSKFGNNLAIDEKTIVVGSDNDFVHLVYNDNGTWDYQNHLSGSNVAHGTTNFGSSLDIKGDVIAIGGQGDIHQSSGLLQNTGAYIFEKGSDGNWSETFAKEGTTSVPMGLGMSITYTADQVMIGSSDTIKAYSQKDVVNPALIMYLLQ